MTACPPVGCLQALICFVLGCVVATLLAARPTDPHQLAHGGLPTWRRLLLTFCEARCLNANEHHSGSEELNLCNARSGAGGRYRRGLHALGCQQRAWPTQPCQKAMQRLVLYTHLSVVASKQKGAAYWQAGAVGRSTLMERSGWICTSHVLPWRRAIYIYMVSIKIVGEAAETKDTNCRHGGPLVSITAAQFTP